LAAGAAVAAFSAVIYAACAAPGGYWDDGGEVVAVALRGGILHPPGHALPSLVFAALGSARAVVWAAAAATAIALGLLPLMARSFADGAGGGGRVAWAAVLALTLGSLDALWRFATTPEVYAFLALALTLLYCCAPRPNSAPSTEGRRQFLAGHVGALACATHVLALPAALPISLAHLFTAPAARRPAALGRLAVGALLGSSILLYLPIRGDLARSHVWGAPHRLRGLVDHLLAADFAAELGGDAYRALPSLDAWKSLGPGWGMIAALGILALLRPRSWRGRRRGLTAVLLGAAGGGVALAWRFGGGLVLDAYLVPVAIPLTLAAAYSIPIPRRRRSWMAAAAGLILVRVAWTAVERWPERDLSGFEDSLRYGEALARCAPDSALVLLDNTLDLFALEEFRVTTGRRGDLVVVYLPMAHRAWAMERALASLGPTPPVPPSDEPLPEHPPLARLLAAAGSRPVLYAPLEHPAFAARELRPHGLLFRRALPAPEASASAAAEQAPPGAEAAAESFLALARRSDDRHTRRRATLVLGRRAEWETRMGRLEQAERSWRRAVGLSPDDERLLHNLGVVRDRLGDLPGAEQAWREAVERAGSAASESSLALGRALFEQSKAPAAIEVWRAALEAGADGYALRFNLGEALLGTGEPGLAADHLARATELRSGSAESWERLALALRLVGREGRAAAAATRAETLRASAAVAP